MALRRKLPSRMAPDTAPEGTSASKKPVETTAQTEVADTSSTADQAAPSPATTASSFQSGAMAEAAMSAFGDLPQPAAAPRVLEDSFAASTPATLEPAQEIMIEPLAQQGAESLDVAAANEPVHVPVQAEEQPAAAPEEPAFVVPAWQEPIQAEPQAVEQEVPPTTAPAWEAPATENVSEPQVSGALPETGPEPEAIKPEPVEAAAPVLQDTPAPLVTDFMPGGDATPAEEPAAVAPAEDVPQAVGLEPEQTPDADAPSEEAAETPDGPTDFALKPSRPGRSRIKRRVREKRARDFSAMGAPEDQKPNNKPVTTAFAPTVPVDDKPLDQVDDALIATGVMAPPPADSLTSKLPGSLAESTTPFAQDEPAEKPFVSELVAKQQEPKVETAPQQEPVAVPDEQSAASQDEPMLSPQSENKNERDRGDTATSVPLPSFNLSNTSQEEEAPLPAPQSGLPWAQPPAAAEWDIGKPTLEQDDWQHNTVESASEPAMHMPPQADLYKTLGGGSTMTPPTLPGGIPAASGKMAFTPELPGQRRKAQGTPWALVVVGIVVVVAAGAYLMTSGQQSGGTQLAQANRTATGNEQQPLLPPPEQAGSGSFMPAEAPPVESNAIVNFADVPPEEANKPIVATGDEDIPQGIIAQFQSEVEKARARKEGDEALGEQPLETVATEGSSYTQEDLKKELEAYRNALASSADPVDLKPATFDANERTGKTDAELASGALLPPPSSATPPEELYTNNPRNLPVVAEPVVNAPDRVRTLADFPEAGEYVPAREKVEIPANIRPKMAATDFPSLEVLSFVPGQGIVAYADGREGVLLIGESLDGWELVAVNGDSANFRTGRKTYQVTADN